MATHEDQTSRDNKAENLCRWAAARAGVIVVAPGVGTMALMANEIYMIMRIGKVYDVNVSQSAATGFLASLGAAFAGQTLATLVPFPPMQIAVGVSVTYAVGKAAQAWIVAGMPSNLDSIRAVFDKARIEAKAKWKTFIMHPEKDVPLGDEHTEIKLLIANEEDRNEGENKKRGASIDKGKGRERLERIAKIKEEVTQRISKLPLGNEIIGPALDYIFNDSQVKQVIDAIQNPRPLRIVFVGQTGAGKSSLINALAGKYLAEVSDSVPGQKQAEKHCIYDGDRVLFEVVDTRGIADACPNAEVELEHALKGFRPDIMLLISPINSRAYVDEDIRNIYNIRKKYFDGALPVIVLLTKADQMNPHQEPMNSERKQANILAARDRVAGISHAVGLSPLAIMPVSSYIDWSENRLDMVYDGRYNIETLHQLIINNVELAAALQLAFKGQIQYAVRLVAERFVNACAATAGTVGINPLPVADITVLTGLQAVMVSTVAYLGGRDLDEDGIKEFISGLGLHIPTALALRELARSLAPVFGSVVSGSIAAGGTYSIGVSAIAYYIDGKPQSALSNIFDSAQKWANDQLKNKGIEMFKSSLKK